MKNPATVVRAVAAAMLLSAGSLWLEACSRGHVSEDGDARPVGSAASPEAAPTAQPAASQKSSAPVGPKLVLEKADYDFGKMETGRTGRHAFVLANQGDRPLVLSRGRSSCGCCTCVCDAQLPERGEVLPGGSARVTLQWKIRRYTGNFRQSETLRTNDPRRPEVTLGVSGRVTPTVRVVPAQLVFTRVPAGQPATGEVRLYGYRERPLKILGHELSDPAQAADFEIACVPMPADEVAAEPDARSGCLLRVKVKPGLAAGPFRQQIVLVTNVDSAATVEVPVQGTVGAQLIVAGFGWEERSGVLTLGTIAAAKGAERKLYVVARGPHARQVKLQPVRIVPDLLQVDLGPGKPLGDGTVIRFPLTIRIPPGSRTGNYLGTRADELGRIVLRTGHPQQPELQILVRFAVKADPAR
jgi:hypothetical protein